MVKISVIIPVYNAKDYIERCLDSVVNQTLKDIEIICVNDCSTDNSIDILNAYAKQYKNIKVIDCKTNGGESRARNIGLDNATGEYIAFVDNDDKIDLNFYEKLYNAASDGDFDIAKAEAKEIGYDGTIYISAKNDKINKYGKSCFTSHWWTAIYKRELLNLRNIRLPENFILGGDLLFLNTVILNAMSITTVNGVYYIHILRENSGDGKQLSRVKIDSVLQIYQIILENINCALRNKTILDYEYDNLYYSYAYGGVYISKKVNSDELLCLCAKNLIENYNMCFRKQQLIKKYIENGRGYLLPSIIKNEDSKLVQTLKLQNNEKIIANLRAKLYLEKYVE